MIADPHQGDAARIFLARSVLLPPEEVDALAVRVAAGDREAEDLLIRSLSRLAYRMAEWQVRVSRNAELDDAVQVAALAILDAARTYDPALGSHFSTYVAYSIRTRLRAHAHSQDLIRVPLHTQVKASRDPDGERAERVWRALRPARERDLNGLRMEEWAATGEPDPDEPDPEESARVARWAAGALGLLSDRERRVITLRHGLDGRRPFSLREIGLEMGISYERVRQIESRAVEILSGERVRTPTGRPPRPVRKDSLARLDELAREGRRLTTSRAAEILAVGLSTINLWVSKGLLPAIKARRGYSFDPADLAALVRSRQASPSEFASDPREHKEPQQCA